jgi:hypothetical protein
VQSEIANAVVKELEIKVLGHVLLTEKR